MTTCKICDSKTTSKFFDHPLYPLIKCDNCGAIWQEHFPTEEELTKFYQSEYYSSSDDSNIQRTDGTESTDLNYKRSLYTYTSIKRTIGKPKSLLDVGCGNNYLLDFASKDGIDAEGLEISINAANRLINNGIKVFIGAISDFEQYDKKFEVVSMFHVLEHLSNPVRDLEILANKITDSGILLIEVPDIDSKIGRKDIGKWWLFQPNEHLFYYNQKSLTYLLNKVGFEVIKVQKREGLGFSRSINNKEIIGGISIKKLISSFIGKFFWIKVIFERTVNLLGYNNVIRIYARKKS